VQQTGARNSVFLIRKMVLYVGICDCMWACGGAQAEHTGGAENILIEYRPKTTTEVGKARQGKVP